MWNFIRQSAFPGGSTLRSRLSKLLLPNLHPPKPQSPSSSAPPKIKWTKEEPDYYHIGGYHRVSLGDTFNSSSARYTVLRKLGYGEYSTVWLAQSSEAQKYVALKILRAEVYGGEHEIFEREILRKVAKVSSTSNHEGRHHISYLLDEFKHTGPNGEHVCFVFDVLGHHLYHQAVHFKYERIPAEVMKIIARQLLLALDFLHRECGVIHTDLQPSNIVFELENPQETVSRYLSETPVRRDEDVKDAIVPMREVIKTPILTKDSKPRIRLIDLGVASWVDKRLTDHIQSPALRAPEVTIGAPWGTGVDIWSLACVLTEFLHGVTLFRCKDAKNGQWTADDDRLGKMIEGIGPFPPEFLKRGLDSSDFFDDDGNLIRLPRLPPSKDLKDLIDGVKLPFTRPEGMDDREVALLIDFIRGMLVLDPDHRKTTAELLEHDWLKS